MKKNKNSRGEEGMSRIRKSISELVGNTPLLELTNYEKNNSLEAQIIVKLEYFNPTLSTKDRIALAMIEEAEITGKLKKGFTIDKFLQVNLHQLDRLRQLIQISSEASVDVLTKMDMYSKARVPNI